MQVGLTLTGEFGVFDGGKSEAKIRALINKANSVRQRQYAVKKDLETRLASLKSEIDVVVKTIEQSKLDLEFYTSKFEEAREKSANVSFNLSEILSADESILDAKLKLIDQQVDLENLWAEVLNIHGIYPDLFKITFDDIGQ